MGIAVEQTGNGSTEHCGTLLLGIAQACGHGIGRDGQGSCIDGDVGGSLVLGAVNGAGGSDGVLAALGGSEDVAGNQTGNGLAILPDLIGHITGRALAAGGMDHGSQVQAVAVGHGAAAQGHHCSCTVDIQGDGIGFAGEVDLVAVEGCGDFVNAGGNEGVLGHIVAAGLDRRNAEGGAGCLMGDAEVDLVSIGQIGGQTGCGQGQLVTLSGLGILTHNGLFGAGGLYIGHGGNRIFHIIIVNNVGIHGNGGIDFHLIAVHSLGGTGGNIVGGAVHIDILAALILGCVGHSGGAGRNNFVFVVQLVNGHTVYGTGGGVGDVAVVFVGESVRYGQLLTDSVVCIAVDVIGSILPEVHSTAAVFVGVIPLGHELVGGNLGVTVADNVVPDSDILGHVHSGGVGSLDCAAVRNG